MFVVDLFAGLGGWSAAARDRGHEVVTVDIEPRFGCDLTVDVFDLDPRAIAGADLLLASPPCEAFSTLTAPTLWRGDRPLTGRAREAVRILRRTLELIEEARPRRWVMENPRGKMRLLPELAAIERRTVDYCRLGLDVQKPTDLWGGFPAGLALPARCRTFPAAEVGEDGAWRAIGADGEPCHLTTPPRRAGRRGNNLQASKASWRSLHGTSDAADLAAARAMVPRALSELVVIAAEKELDNVSP